MRTNRNDLIIHIVKESYLQREDLFLEVRESDKKERGLRVKRDSASLFCHVCCIRWFSNTKQSNIKFQLCSKEEKQGKLFYGLLPIATSLSYENPPRDKRRGRKAILTILSRGTEHHILRVKPNIGHHGYQMTGNDPDKCLPFRSDQIRSFIAIKSILPSPLEHKTPEQSY